MTTQDRLQNIVNKIVQAAQPEQVLLFGSRAWGTPSEGSDIDVFVIQESDKTRFEREVALRRAIFPAGVAVDIISYTPEEVKQRSDAGDPFIKKIIAKGKVLYAA